MLFYTMLSIHQILYKNSKETNMKWKKKVLVSTLLLSGFMTHAMATEETNSTKRFTTASFQNQKILQDSYSKLEWVNGRENNSTTDGCKGFPENKKNTHINIKEKAIKYCENLDFASYNDWRVPSAKEHQALIQGTQEENLSLYYSFSRCPRVIALDEEKNLNTVNTHNTNPIAKIIPWIEGQAGGVRCVRDAEEPLTP